MSTRHVENYFERAMSLHDTKIACFLGLSRETSENEKARFRTLDLASEVRTTIERFEAHPEERAESLPLISALLFGGSDGVSERIDARIVEELRSICPEAMGK